MTQAQLIIKACWRHLLLTTLVVCVTLTHRGVCAHPASGASHPSGQNGQSGQTEQADTDQGHTDQSNPSQDDQEETVERHPWELSFGTTQLFEGWFGESELNLPVSSATLMLSRQLGEYVNLWAIFNLPLVPSQEVQPDGSTRLTRSAPVFLAGASLILFNTKLSKSNRLSADLGLYGGKILRKDGPYFPLSALRLNILKGQDTTIYLGLSASVGVDTLGLVYGVGHRF